MKLFYIAITILTHVANSQQILRGEVTDESHNPLVGVSIELVGTQRGTTSGENGYFELELNKVSEVKVKCSFVGYTDLVESVANFTNKIQFILKENVESGEIVTVTSDRVQRFRPLRREIVQEEIEMSAAPDMASVLDAEVGVTFNANNQIMLQGLDPEYTLVVIDGVPALSGNDEPIRFDEINAFNVKKVEILRGPSSFIFGRGAVGGVVNITTNKGSGAMGKKHVRLLYKEPEDINANVGLNFPVGTQHINASGGYQQRKDPFSDRVESKITGRIGTNIAIRKAWNINTQLSGSFLSSDALEDGENTKDDIQFVANGTRMFSETNQFQTKLLHTRTNSVYEGSESIQNLNQFDLLYDFKASESIRAFVGTSFLFEAYESDFIKDFTEDQKGFGFFAAIDWRILDSDTKVDFLIGARNDFHSQYKPFISPKVATAISRENVEFRIELGRSFKAPTFSEMFTSFSNVTYDIVGSNLVKDFADQDLIEQPIFLVDQSSFGKLKPEDGSSLSASMSVGVPQFKSTISVAYSYTNLQNYIDLIHVMSYTDSREASHKIFSYQNLSHIRTQTIDAKYVFRLNTDLKMSLGYQYLDAINVDDEKRIKRGEVLSRYGNVVKLSDYGGLFNRSKHQVKFTFTQKFSSTPLTLYASVNYRSPYGNRTKDNGNFILDANSEYEDGYTLISSAVSYDFTSSLQSQLRIENLSNVVNQDLNLSGRKFQLSLTYRFN